MLSDKVDFVSDMRFMKCLDDAIDRVCRDAKDKISQDGPENAVDTLNALKVAKEWIDIKDYRADCIE
jgi:hypothetical protein